MGTMIRLNASTSSPSPLPVTAGSALTPEKQNNGVSTNTFTDDDLFEEPDNKIRVGREFQAVVPQKLSDKPQTNTAYREKATLIWSPFHDLSEEELDKYLHAAKEEYNYNMEQALGMLFFHSFSLTKAQQDMKNFAPYPEEWSEEDKVLFEQAYEFHKKRFDLIHQMLPDKTIGMLVRYYYMWKKKSARSSSISRRLQKAHSKGLSLTNGEEETSGNADEEWLRMMDDIEDEARDQVEEGSEPVLGKEINCQCDNCAIVTTCLTTGKRNLCVKCHDHFSSTGEQRQVVVTEEVKRRMRRHMMQDGKVKAPWGIRVNKDDLMLLLSGPPLPPAVPTSPTNGPAGVGKPGNDELVLKTKEEEVITWKRKVQNNKQALAGLKRKMKQATESEEWDQKMEKELVSFLMPHSEFETGGGDAIDPEEKRRSNVSNSIPGSVVESSTTAPPASSKDEWLPHELESLSKALKEFETDVDTIVDLFPEKYPSSILGKILELQSHHPKVKEVVKTLAEKMGIVIGALKEIVKAESLATSISETPSSQKPESMDT
ncbi:unnamed protein product [Cyprideis torosa]|uniref:Uncharacterized protein n=1 Tax=Cyprideis torosa TaxID=163714 RepID=A0A7R8WKS6_9CRUS|nr:unnamed protein product [Cyprideis torosa]CAG0896430.1 unnamed protein product [Cyprideis torosa]